MVTDKDFYEYPTIEVFKQKLQELRNMDFSEADKNKIGETLFSYLPVIPSLITKHSAEQFSTFNFYRVRLNVKEPEEDINLVSTFSYPMPQFCKTNGRANLKYKSVFYSTNSAFTAIMESRPKVDEIGYLISAYFMDF